MIFKAKIASLMSALILAGSAFASQEICPDLAEIQAEGLNIAESLFGFYFTMNMSTYNTDTNWGFIIAPIEAGSDDEALEIGNDILNNMSAHGIPEYDQDTIICSYETGVPGILAIAAQQSYLNSMKLRQYIQKGH